MFVLMGDGEQGEGSNWEAAMFASHHCLDNLVGIIDRNGLQINGSTREVLDTRDLREKYAAFGWSVKVVDGHNIEELLNTFQSIPFQKGKPSMVITNTIKSKGMPFAEGNVKYHHWNPGKDSCESKEAQEALEHYTKEKGWAI
ncbi:hypothetical protein [Acetobacterium wieringae]|uniref:hypothetical protein n=1 Tax=Acetobacterium wieringae TaxID=52694 RepID=UPI0023EB05E9|nr:hypothetical protein [Acetobacterium wieringae]